MKTLTKKQSMLAALAAVCTLSLAGGVMAANGASAETDASPVTTLAGFTCAGASVNAEQIGMRFQFDIKGEALDKITATSTNGVVYIPFDLYPTGELTLKTENAATATFAWKDNTDTTDDLTDKVGYTYLDPGSIPDTMYNRVLLVRGYIKDGDSVVYTAPVKASMAHSAWQASHLPETTTEEKATLKAYTGGTEGYTLSYGTEGEIKGLHYGDTFNSQLPETIGEANVDKWYWDEEKTNEIKADDYATGSMQIYYALETFTVSGTVSCADSISLSDVVISSNGKTLGEVGTDGKYSLTLEAGSYDLVFRTTGYVAKQTLKVSEKKENNDITLLADTYEIGDFGNMKSHGDYTESDALTGSFVMGNSKASKIFFPNTATTKDFEYTVSMSTTESNNYDQSGIGILISNGNTNIEFMTYHWEAIIVNISTLSDVDPAIIGYYNTEKTSNHDTKTLIITKIDKKLSFYINGYLLFSVTKESGFVNESDATNVINSKWTVNNTSLENKLTELKDDIFNENTQFVGGLINGINQGARNTNVSSMSFAELATVSGKITAPEGVELDLTETALTVGDVAYDITVGEDGNYTASIPVGTRTLSFVNGNYTLTVKDVEVKADGSTVQNVALKDGTWMYGTHGSVASGGWTAIEGDPMDKSVTIKGDYYYMVFDKKATTKNFTFEVTVNAKDYYGNNRATNGILISNGKTAISVAFGIDSGWGFVNLSTSRATDGSVYGWGQLTSGKITVVRTQEKISVCLNDVEKCSFTKDGFNCSLTPGWGNDFSGDVSGFFGENVELAVGLASNSVAACGSTCTYSYNLTINN